MLQNLSEHTLVESEGGDWAAIYTPQGNLLYVDHTSDVYRWLVENLPIQDRYSEVLFDDKEPREKRTAATLDVLAAREAAKQIRDRRIAELEAELEALRS